MTTGKLNRFGTLVIFILVAIIVISGIVVWLRYGRSQAIEIAQAPNLELYGEIYISGAVNNPGLYSLIVGDSIDNIIQAAGGTTGDADLSQLKLYIPEVGGKQPQKIDINRAEIWLLKALPGIGEVRAEAIVSYRCQNGPFRTINELIKVEGIGTTVYDQIKELITVAE